MGELFERLLVLSDDEPLVDNSTAFDHEVLTFVESQQNDDILNILVHSVLRNPKDLLAHMRRIYFCYQKQLSEQLYAALADFLIILAGKGQKVAKRVVYGCRSQIIGQQFVTLKNCLQQPGKEKLISSPYSVLAPGWIGTIEVVEYLEENQTEHDLLVLANDYIEYSQLEEAIGVLETGVHMKPERVDVQQMLLELYKSTKSVSRFQDMYKSCIELQLPLIAEWAELDTFFSGMRT